MPPSIPAALLRGAPSTAEGFAEWMRSHGDWQTGLPDVTDERILLRQYQRKQRLAAMGGRASTFLTGPRGIGPGLPTSDMARAFLGAAIGEEPGPTALPGILPEPALVPVGAPGGSVGSAVRRLLGGTRR